MRVRISRAINYYLLGGKKGVMVSTRVYVEHRQTTTTIIDWMFFILRGERNHSRNSFLWEYGGEHEAQKEADKIGTETPQGKAAHHETGTPTNQKGDTT